MKDLTIMILMIFFILLMLFSVRKCANKITKMDNEYKEYVGKKIVLDSDTLKIIDYSIWRENVTLSNGAVLHFELVKKSETFY